jgi:hypothetical protein
MSNTIQPNALPLQFNLQFNALLFRRSLSPPSPRAKLEERGGDGTPSATVTLAAALWLVRGGDGTPSAATLAPAPARDAIALRLVGGPCTRPRIQRTHSA